MRFLVETPSRGQFEDVAAEWVRFTPTHVVFYKDEESLVVAYRAQDVLTIVKEEE